MEGETSVVFKMFKVGVLERFPPPNERTIDEELFGLCLIKTVQEFKSRFELLSIVVDGLTEDTMKTIFINGLL